jgi:hypothetical protein
MFSTNLPALDAASQRLPIRGGRSAYQDRQREFEEGPMGGGPFILSSDDKY